MRLKKIEKTRKCDIKGCECFADFGIETKGFFKRKIYICENCLKQIFKNFAMTSVPKPIGSPFKPNSRIKKEKR